MPLRSNRRRLRRLIILSITTVAASAQADIVHRVLNQPLPSWNLGPSRRHSMAQVDINGDGVHDTQFHYNLYIPGVAGDGGGSVTGCANRCPPQPTQVEMIHIDDMVISPSPLAPGVPIVPASVNGIGVDFLFAIATYPSGTVFEMGPFADSPPPIDGVPRHESLLIGFSNAEWHGWMRIRSTLHGPTGRYPDGFTQFRLIDLAYRATDDGGDILPGQVPAPASVATLLLGGLLVVRRRQ